MQYAKVFPLSKVHGIKMSPKWYRLSIGWSEVVCGTILLLVPGWWKSLLPWLYSMKGVQLEKKGIRSHLEKPH